MRKGGTPVAHLVSGLAIGGKERAALRLARRGLGEGQDHLMLLYDTPFRDAGRDFDPGEVPTVFLRRAAGLDLGFAWRLARLIGQRGVGVVHAHNDTALFYAAIARRLLARPPRLVATFHTWPTASPLARRLNRLAARGAQVVAVSSELGGRLCGTGWLKRCGIIQNGVELDAFFPAPPTNDWRRALGVPATAVLVGHVARFDPIKRHVDLVAAAALLARAAPEVVLLLLVGQGPLADEVLRSAAGLGNIRFVPQVTDMHSLLNSLDMLTLCSAHEAAPLVVLEAMACGVPVVATAVGGLPPMVGSGADAGGVLVPPCDPTALAKAIGALAGQPARRARLGEAARRRAVGFSFDVEWAAYAALYRGPA